MQTVITPANTGMKNAPGLLLGNRVSKMNAQEVTTVKTKKSIKIPITTPISGLNMKEAIGEEKFPNLAN